jgi:hypothetical protein
MVGHLNLKNKRRASEFNIQSNPPFDCNSSERAWIGAEDVVLDQSPY